MRFSLFSSAANIFVICDLCVLFFHQVGNEERIHVYYAHGEDTPTFVRRCYWLLDKYVSTNDYWFIL